MKSTKPRPCKSTNAVPFLNEDGGFLRLGLPNKTRGRINPDAGLRSLSAFEKSVYTQASGKRVPFCLVQRWPWQFKNFLGFALGFLVFVNDDTDVGLVCHEVAHVTQFWARPFTFLFRYLYEFLRFGYHHNRFEWEARQVEQKARRILLAPQVYRRVM